MLIMRLGMPQPASLPDLRQLFAEDSHRASSLSWQLGGMTFDWSKLHLTSEWLGTLQSQASNAGYGEAIDRLFAGEVINTTEGRAAEHLAERGSGSDDSVALATARRRRMFGLIDAIEAGAFGDVTGVLHIGIGGSALGPALLVDALGRRERRYNRLVAGKWGRRPFRTPHSTDRRASEGGRVRDRRNPRASLRGKPWRPLLIVVLDWLSRRTRTWHGGIRAFA
jgi:hypothetical protein